MANRRPQPGRRMDFQRNDRGKNFGRNAVSPWQGGGPSNVLPNILPLGGGPTEATLALASNLINLLQPRQNPVPSLLDMPIRRDFGPAVGRYDPGYGPNRMGNHGNFRRTGNYNRIGERIGNNRKPFRPNDGQRQHNKSSPKKEADSKAKPVKESETAETGGAETEQQDKEAKDEDTKKDSQKTRYDDINSQLLKCHICNKSMWDGRSFENHLNGRAHAIMMQKTAESYALTADTMRQEFKIREMKRTRKAGHAPARDFYCAMCDMYAGDGALHRTTVGHRKLKKYLHPTCTACHKEMPTRIELDEHRLTAEHLKTMQDKQDVGSKPKPEVMVISTLEQEQSYVREDRPRRRFQRDRKQTGERDHDDGDNKEADGENQDEPEIKKEAEDGAEEKEGDGEDKKQEIVDAENTIVDYKEGDDLTGTTLDMLPTYSTKRGVGRSFLTEFRCVQCVLCRKLLDSPETADTHLRTWRHHQLFTKLVSEKGGLTPNREATKRNIKSEEENDSKRRKTDADDEGNADDQNGHEEVQDAAKDNLEEIDTDMPDADQLEDWEQSVDEILEDEKNARADDAETEEVEETSQPEAEAPEPAKAKSPEPAKEKSPEPVKEKSPEPAKTKTPEPAKVNIPPPAKLDDKPRASPRGRGRGRGRGRY